MLDQLFSLATTSVLPAWLLLALYPRRWVTHILSPVVLPALLALLYLGLLLSTMVNGSGEGDFSSIDGVRTLFANDAGLLAGWVHYLAFDLVVGSWEVRDAQRVGIRHVLVVPCLFFTLMFGPVGLLMYLALRARQAPVEALEV